MHMQNIIRSTGCPCACHKQ